jgi:hypothetical protein
MLDVEKFRTRTIPATFRLLVVSGGIEAVTRTHIPRAPKQILKVVRCILSVPR